MGDLVIIGSALADRLELPFDQVPGEERCVVVVKAGTQAMTRPEIAPIEKTGA